MHSDKVSKVIAKNFPDKFDTLEAIIGAVESGLWHEATLLLFQIVESRELCKEHGVILYESFLRVGVMYMNPIEYASIILQLTAGIAVEKALEILQDTIATQKQSLGESVEATFALQCAVAIYCLENTGDLGIAHSTLREIQSYIESREGQPVSALLCVQKNLLQSLTAWQSNDFHAAVNAGLRLYDYRETKWAAHLSCPDDIWTKTAQAMLLDPRVIEFGDLLQKEVMVHAMKEAVPKAYELLVCMQDGDRVGASAVIDDSLGLVRTDSCIQVLREKILITSFLHYVHRLPKEQREITFSDISTACTCTADTVELLLLTALDRGFVAGKIDGRNENFLMENIQPRYVTKADIPDLKAGLDVLISNISTCEELLRSR